MFCTIYPPPAEDQPCDLKNNQPWRKMPFGNDYNEPVHKQLGGVILYTKFMVGHSHIDSMLQSRVQIIFGPEAWVA